MTRVPADLAAHAAGVAPATLRQWVRRGHIRHYPDGYDLREITDHIERRNSHHPGRALARLARVACTTDQRLSR